MWIHRVFSVVIKVVYRVWMRTQPIPGQSATGAEMKDWQVVMSTGEASIAIENKYNIFIASGNKCEVLIFTKKKW